MQESDSLPIAVAVFSAIVAAAVSLLVLAMVSFAVFSAFQADAGGTVTQEVLLPSSQDDVPASSAQSPTHQEPTPAPTFSAAPPVTQHELVFPSLESIGLSRDDYAIGDFAANVEECLQFPQLPGGCEIASMVSVLRALGFETDLLAFTDDYVLKMEGQPEMVYSYSGSPYESGAAFPPVMARAGNAYFKDQGSYWRFIEPEAPSIDDLLRIIETGRPVLVWTTMYGESPQFTSIEVGGYEWYSNEHCVALYGTTEEGDLKVMDPMVGLTTQNRAAFEDVYVACGQHALVPTQTQASTVDAAEFKLVASFAQEE